MTDEDRDALGQMAYAIYREHHASYQPLWWQLQDEDRKAWREAATAIYGHGRMYEWAHSEESEAE